MPDRVLRFFCVRCLNCDTALVTVPLLGAEEIALCEDHIRACWERDPLTSRPLLGDVMRLVRITIVGTPSEALVRLH